MKAFFQTHHKSVIALIGAALLLSFSAFINVPQKAYHPNPTGRGILGEYLLSTNANSALQTGDSAGLAYYVDTGTNTAVVGKGSCTDAVPVIPTAYNAYPIVGIKDDGFNQATSVTGISFHTPTNITTLGYQSFAYSGLSAFDVPASVLHLYPSVFLHCEALASCTFSGTPTCTSIESYCFAGDLSLTSLTLPATVTEIGEGAFQGCLNFANLENMATSTVLSSIGAYAFADCVPLGLAYFSTAIAYVGPMAFKGCTKCLASFAAATAPSWTSLDACADWNFVYTDAKTLAKHFLNVKYNVPNVSTAGDCIYYQYDKTTPPTGYGYDVVIYYYSGSNDSFTIPNTISKDNALHRVVGIDTYAFQAHTELLNVTMGANIQFINDYAFYGCNFLTSLNFSACTTLLTIGNFAFSPDTYNTADYTSTIAVTSLSIPSTLTSIGANAFQYYSILESLTFGDGSTTATASKLVTIGNYAFQYAGKSTFSDTNYPSFTLSLPTKKLKTVGVASFKSALFIRYLNFPTETSYTNALTLGNYAFQYTLYLSGITFPTKSSSNNKSITINNYVFALSAGSHTGIVGLHSVYLPSTITTLNGNSFEGRERLTLYSDNTALPSNWTSFTSDACWTSSSSVFPGTASNDDGFDNYSAPIYWSVGGSAQRKYTTYTDASGCKFDFLQTGVSATTCILTRYYYDSESVDETITVPTSVGISGTACSVTSIGRFAFFNSCNNPNSALPAGATLAKNLMVLNLPNTLTSIEGRAFAGSFYLKEVTAYSSAPGDMTTYTFPTALSSLGIYAFAYTNLTTVYLPGNIATFGGTDSVLSIYASPFVRAVKISTITTASGSGSVSAEGNVVYSGTTVVGCAPDNTSFTIRNTTSEIADEAFRGSVFTSLSLPNSITRIGYSAFYYCTAWNQSVDLSSMTGLTTIGDKAFSNCKAITGVSFPTSLTTIPSQCFKGDLALTNVNFAEGMTTVQADAFNGCTRINALAFPSTTTTIASQAFYNNNSLTSLSLNSGLTSIGDSAFSTAGSASITSLSIPASVTSIGAKAFYKFAKPTSLTIGTQTASTSPAGSCALTSLGSQAFESLTSLASVYIASDTSVQTTTSPFIINDSAFKSDTALRSVVLPENVKFLGTPFIGCTATSTKVYLATTGAEYESRYSAGGWYSTGWAKTNTTTNATVTYAFYAANASDKSTTTLGSSLTYWHYVDGVPTIY